MYWQKSDANVDACTLQHTACYKQCIVLYAQLQDDALLDDNPTLDDYMQSSSVG